MGAEFSLQKDGKICKVEWGKGTIGSTQVVGGSCLCEAHVTYNYYDKFAFHRELCGKTGAETIPILEGVIERMGTIEPTGNYWISTEGNVGYIAAQLLDWAKQYPDAVWIEGWC